MTFEELAEKILALPKEQKQQEAIVYCDDHAAEDGRYTCSLQVSRGNPRIHANIMDNYDDDYDYDYSDEED